MPGVLKRASGHKTSLTQAASKPCSGLAAVPSFRSCPFSRKQASAFSTLVGKPLTASYFRVYPQRPVNFYPVVVFELVAQTAAFAPNTDVQATHF